MYIHTCAFACNSGLQGSVSLLYIIIALSHNTRSWYYNKWWAVLTTYEFSLSMYYTPSHTTLHSSHSPLPLPQLLTPPPQLQYLILSSLAPTIHYRPITNALVIYWYIRPLTNIYALLILYILYNAITNKLLCVARMQSEYVIISFPGNGYYLYCFIIYCIILHAEGARVDG